MLSFVSSMKDHPQVRLRFFAIVAASHGCLFTFVVLLSTLTGLYRGSRSLVIGCAYIAGGFFAAFMFKAFEQVLLTPLLAPAFPNLALLRPDGKPLAPAPNSPPIMTSFGWNSSSWVSHCYSCEYYRSVWSFWSLWQWRPADLDEI